MPRAHPAKEAPANPAPFRAIGRDAGLAMTPPSAADLLTIVRQLPDVVFRCVKDARGRIVWTLNEGRLAEEFHSTTRDVYGKTLHEFFPPDVADRQLPFFEAAFRGEAVEWVNEMGGRRFKHFPQPVRDASGKVVAVVGFISEVTGLVAAQRRAEDLNVELMARMADLREANRRLEQANQDLEAFAGSVSHDLGQPLTLLSSHAYALETRLRPGADAATMDSIARIQGGVQRMADLTHDLLAFSRAAQQALRIEDVDVGDLAWKTAQALQSEAPQRAVDWEMPRHAVVRGDPGLLRVALDNLLGNAWKYTSAKPRARIMLHVDAGPGHAITVTDDGIGFDPAEAGRLFQAFERLPSGRSFPGTGVGLATVRRIVERHGGQITAHAQPGHGATFRFTLAPPA